MRERRRIIPELILGKMVSKAFLKEKDPRKKQPVVVLDSRSYTPHVLSQK